MAFRVEILPQAFADLDSIAEYIKTASNFATAEIEHTESTFQSITKHQPPVWSPFSTSGTGHENRSMQANWKS